MKNKTNWIYLNCSIDYADETFFEKKRVLFSYSKAYSAILISTE